MSYGIIAYSPNAKSPQNDEAHFNGWYADRKAAEEVFGLFVRDYPTALVHLVRKVDSRWGKDAVPAVFTASQLKASVT